MSDKTLTYEDLDFASYEDFASCIPTIRRPKHIATVTICGAAVIYIDDDMPWIQPTEEQIKNLHDLLCIDVELIKE